MCSVSVVDDRRPARAADKRHGHVAVIGAGAAGLALAAALTEAGITVRLANRSARRVERITQAGITVDYICRGAQTAVDLPVVTYNSIGEAVEGCQTVFLAVAEGAEEQLVREYVGSLLSDATIVLVSGRCGATFACRKAVSSTSWSNRTIVELAFPYVAVSNRPGHVAIIGEKAWLAASAWSSYTNDSLDNVEAILARSIERVSSEWMALHSLPGVIFPLIMICNAGQVARGQRFAFYTEGVFSELGRLLENADRERMAIAEAFNIEPISAVQWFRQSYGVSKAEGIVDILSGSGVYKLRLSPPALHHRFLVDNVELCLVPMVMLAKHSGVRTPIFDSVIELASGLMGLDLRANGEQRGVWIKDLVRELA